MHLKNSFSFVVAFILLIVTNITSASAAWQRFELAPASSASANGGIAAVSRITDSMEVWWVGANGSVQDAFWYAPPPITTRQLTISRHNTAALTNAEADSILNDASTVLQVSDGPDDVACPVALVRSGDVGVFNRFRSHSPPLAALVARASETDVLLTTDEVGSPP
jgi:hypothetical protein